MSRSVLIFGPTGAVGSTAALTAHEEGAKVSLAMRDPTKPIPKLDSISAQRFQADLNKPESIAPAVKQSGATVAYLYVIFDSPDYMRSTVQALKDAGIQSVVLLSSASVENDPHDVPETDFIGNIHAKVEIALEEVFGADSFIAVRPGFFTSNLTWFKEAIRSGEVPLPLPEAKFDYIAPEDIGRVSGAILANGSNQHVVRLFGTEARPMKDAFRIIGEALDQEVKTLKVPLDKAVGAMVARGIDEIFAGVCVKGATEHPDGEYPFAGLSEGASNVRKFTGKEPTTLEQWVEANKGQFV